MVQYLFLAGCVCRIVSSKYQVRAIILKLPKDGFITTGSLPLYISFGSFYFLANPALFFGKEVRGYESTLWDTSVNS